MKISKICIPAIMLSALTGCGLPSIEKAQNTFLDGHAGARLLSVSETITNLHAEFHFIYVFPYDSQEHEEVWSYGHAAERWVGGNPKTVR